MYELASYLKAYIKINSNLIIDLNVNYKSIKLLEEIIAEFLCELELGKDFIYTIQKNMIHKINN